MESFAVIVAERPRELSEATPRPTFLLALSRPWIAAVLWAAVMLHCWILAPSLAARAHRFDFSIYYASALALRQHLDPYTNNLDKLGARLGLEIAPINYATDPPTFLLCFEPLTRLSVVKAFWLWNGINLVCLLAAILLLLGPAKLDRNLKWSLAALAILFAPVGEHFFYSQNKILVLFLLVAFMRLVERKHEAWAGLCLAFSIVIRGFPVLIVGYLLLRRQWRLVLYTGIGVMAGIAVTFAALGIDQTLSFQHGLALVTDRRFLLLPIDISLSAFVNRIFWYALGTTAYPQAPAQLCAVAAELLLLAVTIKATFRSGASRDRDWRVYSLWVLTAVILSPTAWVHYLVIALIPMSLIAEAAARGEAHSGELKMAAASYLLIALSTIGRSAFGPDPRFSPALVLVSELSFVCTMMLYVSTYWFASPSAAMALANDRVDGPRALRALSPAPSALVPRRI